MTPSPVIRKINDRKFFLPSDYETKYNVHLRIKRPKSNINTGQRVFTEYVLTNNNLNTDNLMDNENTNSNFKKNTSYFSYKPIDSICNLISYKYAPKYREQVFLFIFARILN